MKQIATTRNYFILMIIAYLLFAVYFIRNGSKTLLVVAFAFAILAMVLMAIKGDAVTSAETATI